jgi:hypothetical protein
LSELGVDAFGIVGPAVEWIVEWKHVVHDIVVVVLFCLPMIDVTTLLALLTAAIPCLGMVYIAAWPAAVTVFDSTHHEAIARKLAA